ncbi:hypothetical protein [Qipengyuania nanhaisediminis]|uniref:hypothetical protein n=1 Tax=Qipengyuania nanhaisediminis TaxID=604088 RepID=UPI0038B3AD65
MSDVVIDRTQGSAIEAILRDELARENRALRGAAPVITHMLEDAGHGLVTDAVVARVRGMLADIARQLLAASPRDHSDDPQFPDCVVDALCDALASDNALLAHCHALAVETELTRRLEQDAALDPVLSPLMQELVASKREEVAELAMSVLAAQSRFVQTQRRMHLPLGELPAELFGAAVRRFEKAKLGLEAEAIAKAKDVLRGEYDEAESRAGRMLRLVTVLGAGALAALELDHAGLALFASAIAARTRQPRDLAVLACHERQPSRLALSLRAAGLEPDAIERQFRLLHPAGLLPDMLGAIAPDQARALLAGNSASENAHQAVGRGAL